MKKLFLLSLAVLSAVVIVSCDTKKETSSEISASLTQTSTTASTEITTTVTTTTTTVQTTKITVPEYMSENFLSIKSIGEYNDYIYFINSKNELWKCKYDLTDQTLVRDYASYFYIQDSNMYLTVSSFNGQNDVYYFNMDNSNIDIKKIKSYSKSKNIAHPVIYGNKLIYTRNDGRVDIGEIDLSFVDYRTRNGAINLSVMGTNLFYSEADERLDNYFGSYIMKYDMKTGNNEEFFEIPRSKHPDEFYTHYTYANQHIIFQTYYNSYTILDTNTMKTHNIEFDFSEYERGFSCFPFFDKDNLYFFVSDDFDFRDGTKTPYKIFRYTLNAENPVPEYIQDTDCHCYSNIYLASNNNVYYYDYANDKLDYFVLEN